MELYHSSSKSATLQCIPGHTSGEEGKQLWIVLILLLPAAEPQGHGMNKTTFAIMRSELAAIYTSPIYLRSAVFRLRILDRAIRHS